MDKGLRVSYVIDKVVKFSLALKIGFNRIVVCYAASSVNMKVSKVVKVSAVDDVNPALNGLFLGAYHYAVFVHLAEVAVICNVVVFGLVFKHLLFFALSAENEIAEEPDDRHKRDDHKPSPCTGRISVLKKNGQGRQGHVCYEYYDGYYLYDLNYGHAPPSLIYCCCKLLKNILYYISIEFGKNIH